MVRGLAFLVGIVLIVAGVLGFYPQFMQDGLLFGLFEVDQMHNMVHIATGVLALLSTFSTQFARLFFKVFGLLYMVLTIVGFVNGGNVYIMHVNMADNILHAGLAIVFLIIGFGLKRA